MMKQLSNTRLVLLGLALALGLGYMAGGVSAKNDKPDYDGVLVLTPVAEILCQEFKVQVKGDDVFAVRGDDDDKGQVRLLIQGGRGLISNGTLSDGHPVTVTGRDKDKRHTHHGHVTVLK